MKEKTPKPKGSEIITDILNLENLLFDRALTIPVYQRPYKWTSKNVNQLIDDILLHNDKTAYRVGTIVLHNDGTNLNIVDGQQRIFTMSLIAGELLKDDFTKKLISFPASKLCLADAALSNPVSLKNLRRNYLLIKSRIKEFKRDDIAFFFKKCEFVYIELQSISEAFQFFDSQNTRGKDLAPHDLLKAFHLREMVENTEQEKIRCVNDWEAVSDSLNNIFSNYLFRVRRWTKGKHAISFSKNDVDIFKGINMALRDSYEYQRTYRINHFYVDNYNRDAVRQIDRQQMRFPFQIDQAIINGQRFFEYVHHYSNCIKEIEMAYSDDKKIRAESILKYLNPENTDASLIMKTIRTYKGNSRRGDLYIRNVFDCCILYYWDKFGTIKIDDALVKFFLWAYALRLESQAVQATSAHNLAAGGNGFFRMIRESVHPKEILNYSIKPAAYIGKDDAVLHIGEIVKIFRNLNSIQS